MKKSAPATGVAVALLEARSVAADPHLRAARVTVPDSCVLSLEFHDSATFIDGLHACVESLRRQPSPRRKLLVISAHGLSLTGTALTTDRMDRLDPWIFTRNMGQLPKNLVVYLSACWGAYPSVRAFQWKQKFSPTLVGPLVEIPGNIANDFQEDLLDAVRSAGNRDDAIERVVNRYNDVAWRSQFDYRYLFGMIGSGGSQQPQEAINQLATTSEPESATFEITRLKLTRDGYPVKGWLAKRIATGPTLRYRAAGECLMPLYYLGGLSQGRTFQSRYQIVHEQQRSRRAKLIVLLRPTI